MHRRLAWDDLLYVLAVGRGGSLSGAARQLKVTHSTVYRRIGRIEEQLQVRLFDRLRDGYAPTPAGEAMVALATRLDEDILSLERKLAGEDLRPSGTLRVTTTETLVPTVTPLCGAFRRIYPEITLELVTGKEMLNLSRRDADVALRPTVQPDETLVGRRLCTIAFAVYGSKTYLAATGGPDLDRNHEWIGFDDTLSHLLAYGWVARNVSPGRIGFRASSVEAVVEAAAAGLGLALIPCYMADRRPQLVRCTDVVEQAGTGLWLLTHQDLRHTTRVRAFTDFIASELVRLKPLMEGKLARATDAR